MASKPKDNQLTAENYVKEVLARFSDVDLATEALFQWARHDPAVAHAFNVHFLETMPPFGGPLKSRLRATLDISTRPQPVPESEEQRAAFADYLKNFKL